MHIEPGFIYQSKLILANLGALSLLGFYAKDFLLRPGVILRAMLAGLFFSLFMQSFHLPVGPSELHFVGAMVIYLTFGFLPTLFGFAIGLLVQGMLFAPADLMHLAVNSLSLILPLILLHQLKGKKLFKGEQLSFKEIAKLDAIYYSGVSLMVGFWLVGEGVTHFAAWAQFMGAYLAIAMVEPVLTYGILKGLKRFEGGVLVRAMTAVGSLRLA